MNIYESESEDIYPNIERYFLNRIIDKYNYYELIDVDSEDKDKNVFDLLNSLFNDRKRNYSMHKVDTNKYFLFDLKKKFKINKCTFICEKALLNDYNFFKIVDFNDGEILENEFLALHYENREYMYKHTKKTLINDIINAYFEKGFIVSLIKDNKYLIYYRKTSIKSNFEEKNEDEIVTFNDFILKEYYIDLFQDTKKEDKLFENIINCTKRWCKDFKYFKFIDFDDEKQFESEFENLFRFCTKMVDYTRDEIVNAVVYSYLCDGFIVKRTGDNKYLITLAEDEEFDKELIYENLIGLTDKEIEIFKLRYGLDNRYNSVSEIANKMNETEIHVKLCLRDFAKITKYSRSHRSII